MVSLTYPQVPTEVFLVSGFLIKFFKDKNCVNSRTSYDIDMKLGRLSKLGKRNIMASKRWLRLCRQIMTSLSFFWIASNLEQSSCRIPNARSMVFTFSLVTNIHLTKAGNRTEKSFLQLSQYCFEKKALFSTKNADVLQKKC